MRKALLVLLAAVSLRADTPSVDEIISRYAIARGGYEKLQAIRTIIYRGVYREGAHQSDHAAMSLMRPFYKLVGDAEHLSSDFAEGYDGSAWEFYADPGIVVRTVGAASGAGRHATSIDGPLIDYAQRGSTVTLKGIEPIGDRKAYRLLVRMRDGFEMEEFIDTETSLLIATRKVAPIHAFGSLVSSEERISDYRPVEGGALFPFHFEEVEIATGKVLNEMTWTSIVVNHPLDVRVFSPPQFDRTPVQTLMEQIYAEREDVQAVMWTYADFRAAYPDADTRAPMETVGYQMLKMGDTKSAVELLKANAAAYPKAASSAFGLGRAYKAAGENEKARAEWKRALELDPDYKRAREALASLP